MAFNGNRGNSGGTNLWNQRIEYSGRADLTNLEEEVPRKKALVPLKQIQRRLREDLNLPLKKSIVTTVQCNSLVDAKPAGTFPVKNNVNFQDTEEADIDPCQLARIQKKKF